MVRVLRGLGCCRSCVPLVLDTAYLVAMDRWGPNLSMVGGFETLE